MNTSQEKKIIILALNLHALYFHELFMKINVSTINEDKSRENASTNEHEVFLGKQ